MGLDGSHVLFFVTFEAEAPHIFFQQLSFCGLMWIVAGTTLAVRGWVMLESRFAHRLLQVVMTIETQLAVRLAQQLFVIRLMWVMAGGAFAVFHRLVFHLGFGKLLLHIVVAFGA